MSKKPLTDKDGEVRDLAADDFKGARRLKDVHPEIVEAFKAMRGRPPVERPKEQITLRLDSVLVGAIRAEGKGYTSRVEKALRREFLGE